MSFKIHSKLKELEIDLPLDENVFHSQFIKELKEFNEFVNDETIEKDQELINTKDNKLCELFEELHEIEVEVEKPIEVEKPDDTDKEILEVLKSKVNYTYPELEKLGINLKEIDFKFRFKGYVFQKRFLLKEYTIISKP
jgi:hypothetical protein